MRKLIVLVVLLCVGFTYAQKERTLEFNEEKNLIEVTYYHDNGEISQTGYYTKDGKLHGDWNSFCTEGKKLVSAKYDNGKKVGKWLYWIDDKVKEVTYTKEGVTSL